MDTNDVLKNYSQNTKLDEAANVVNTLENAELGFNPYFWISRSELERHERIKPAVLKYKALMAKLHKQKCPNWYDK